MAYTFKHGDRPLEDYTVQRGVGRGGFGEVYYGLSDGGREVALKYLRDNPDIELRGVSACMNLKSPHLVTVFDVKKSAEGEYFIVMEYVSGPSLRDLLLAEPDGLGPQKAAFFVREIARGLSYLHDRGIVHRDLKPGNIFYEDGYVKIGDYGLSKFISVSRHSAQTSSVGTVHYMAPEMGSGNYSRGVDIYALGVMLYEMLLGRVPFEGASLGEVLMKHLTEQPEVDELPPPFGQVIRKALAKDPNDRYQTVDEMVEEIFGVEDIKQSLAGFSPTSLSGVARRAVGDIADSPVPSPNPQRPGVAPFAGPAPFPGAYEQARFGQRLTERMDRIGAGKFDKKLGKLEAKAGRPRHGRSGRGGRPGHGPAHLPARPWAPSIGTGERAQRLVLSAVMALGVATGIGLLIGVSVGDEEGILAGVSSFLLVVAISAGVTLSRWLATVKLSAANPQWASRMILMGCCLPMMLVASIPLLTERDEATLSVLGALLITTLVADWDDRRRRGAAGELSVGPAFYLGILAVILAAVFNADEFVLMAGGVAAAASLSVQALGWAFPPKGFASAGGGGRQARAAGRAAGPIAPPEVRPPAVPVVEPPTPGPAEHRGPVSIPMAIPVEQGIRGAPKASKYPLPPLRSAVARGFWSVVAFALAGGTIVLFVLSLIMDLRTGSKWHHTEFGWEEAVWRPDYEAYMGLITGCVACFSFLIFALRKTTERKRIGFWRETLRPFLTAVAMTGMGAAITALAMPRIVAGDEELAGVIVGLVFSSLLFVVLLFARGRRASMVQLVAGEVQPAPARADDPAAPVAEGQEPAAAAQAVPPLPAGRGDLRPAHTGSNLPSPPLRSAFGRGFWGVAAFLLAAGMVALFVLSVVMEFRAPVEWGWESVLNKATGHSYRSYVAVEWGTDYEMYMGLIMGCTACLAFTIFALRKTTRCKRIGFWRETLRPLLMAVAMTGMGLTITALATPHCLQCDDARAGVIVGLVFSSLLFVVLLFARGRGAPAGFITGEAQPAFPGGDDEGWGVADAQSPAGGAEPMAAENANQGGGQAG